MREIKSVGLIKRGNDSRNYHYSVFLCPACNEHCEKKTRDGKRSEYCSHACYAANRKRRGPYKDFVLISGYLYMQRPDHPNASLKGYVAEHRIVAERYIKRFLRSGEVVHHINEVKTDNRPENLLVMSNQDHVRLHKLGASEDEFRKYSI